MKTLVNRIVLFTAGAVILGSMAYGQTPMKANIPFAFHAAGTTLPAGNYTVVRQSGGAGIVRIWSYEARRGVLALGNPVDTFSTGDATMVFQCNGDDCSLSQIRTPDGSVSYPSHRKAARDAEAAKVVSIPLLAHNGE